VSAEGADEMVAALLEREVEIQGGYKHQPMTGFVLSNGSSQLSCRNGRQERHETGSQKAMPCRAQKPPHAPVSTGAPEASCTPNEIAPHPLPRGPRHQHHHPDVQRSL
jgi:hypothetical protein